MTIKEALKKYSLIEIELLLSHILGKSKEFLYLHPEKKLTRIQVYRLTSMIKRRLKGEPVAYILGYKDFYGLRFKVNKDVLIPRPETERLVEIVLDAVPEFFMPEAILSHKKYPRSSLEHGSESRVSTFPRTKIRGSADKSDALARDGIKPIKILDVGTGSGCIIISLAHKLASLSANKQIQFYGSDVSKKALKVAKQNSKKLLNINLNTVKYLSFVHSDLLNGVKFNPDIIIANLPYGWSEWKNNTSAETVGLRFEPKEALFTQENGLKLIKKLLEQIVKRKQKPKFILLEFDPRQKKELNQIIKKTPAKGKHKIRKRFSRALEIRYYNTLILSCIKVLMWLLPKRVLDK